MGTADKRYPPAPKPTRDWLNILGKWRVLFTGWQLGTRAKGDPEGDAVRDHREITLLLRAESSALTHLLIEKGICTEAEYRNRVHEEARLLNEALEKKFPGVRASESGLAINTELAQPWMGSWKP